MTFRTRDDVAQYAATHKLTAPYTRLEMLIHEIQVTLDSLTWVPENGLYFEALRIQPEELQKLADQLEEAGWTVDFKPLGPLSRWKYSYSGIFPAYTFRIRA